MHEGGEFIGGDQQRVVFKWAFGDSNQGSLGFDQGIDQRRCSNRGWGNVWLWQFCKISLHGSDSTRLPNSRMGHQKHIQIRIEWTARLYPNLLLQGPCYARDRCPFSKYLRCFEVTRCGDE